MRPIKAFQLILFSLSISACIGDKELENRITTCTRGDDYAYLDNYIKGTPCSDNNSQCNEYLDIWKEFFMKQNNLTEDFFNEHITLYGTTFHDWNQGTSFNICYEIKIDWAIAYLCDKFPVKIKTGSNLFPSLPRGTYLTKENIETTIGKSYTSQITKVLNTEILKFTSMDNAVNFLIEKANVKTLCPNRISINGQTGELMLECSAEYDFSKNECIEAKVGLIDGESTINDTVCYISG
ncbi:MAG: hypothetical protein DYG99_00260 [Bacteroidetes bacterium CHB5]|nr:hypothetical protein [Bacteroidetes bacterium CHB5]